MSHMFEEQIGTSTIPYYHRVAIVFGRIVQGTVAVLIVGIFVRLFIGGVSRVDGPSMEPNFIGHQWIAFEKLSYFIREPQRFDAVIATDPTEKVFLLKRIVGTPGDSIEIREGSLFIVNTEGSFIIEEPYTKIPASTLPLGAKNEKILKLGKNEYFILGDNRSASSYDSRAFGPVQRSHIFGKVFRVWR